MKFFLFVEGHTEKAALAPFVKRWLDPRLARPAGVKVIRFDGWRNYVDDIATKVQLSLTGRTGEDVIACVGLLDLYGPEFYPASIATSTTRYAWAKNYLEQRVANPKFKQHFAVHEIEAWLLSDPSIFPSKIRSALPTRAPEEVNFNEPPAKLLERIYESRLAKRYRKVIDGSDLFLDLSPEIAYKKCPYLKILLDDMLQLANAHDPGPSQK